METQAEFHTREQQEAMLKAVKEPRHRVIILLMLDGGMRVSEARKRHWEECDFRAKVIKVNSLKKRENSRKKERIVPMSDRLYTAFDELLKEGVVPKGPIFPGSDDGYLGRSAVNMMLRRLEQKNPAIGETKPHKLRHTAATMLLANGGDLNQVKEFLGHEDVRVTQIYTHAQIEDIRTAINANTPKPTFFQRIRSKLFPQRHSVINLLIPDTGFVVGRDKEQKQIQSLVSRGINVLIVGEIGIGKSHLLQSLNFDKPTLVIDDCSDFKTSIKAAILHVCGDKETASAMLFQTKDLKAVDVKLSTASLPNLVQTLKDVTQPGEYLMKIGNIDGITPRVVKVLEELKDHFTIITTARSVKMEAASFAWSFEKLELKPLQRPDSLKMIYRLISDLQVSDLDAVMTKIYETADGNPRKIRELCDRLRREPFVNLDSVTEVADAYLGRQVEEFDFSVILLVILGGFVLLRYVGRETGEKDLQFIGACIMLVMMFARYFFRSAKRKVL